MLPFLEELTKEFKKVCNESYIEINTAEKVIYPYLTFSYSSESLENTREGFYIDVDIFDHCGANTVGLEELTHKIKIHFENCKILNDEVLLQFKILQFSKCILILCVEELFLP